MEDGLDGNQKTSVGGCRDRIPLSILFSGLCLPVLLENLA